MMRLTNRRILNELHNIIPKKLNENNLDEEFYFAEINSDLIPNNIAVIDKKNNNIIISFNISNDYPFNPPKINIHINDNSYYNYLIWCRDITNIFQKSNKEIINSAFKLTAIKRPYLNSFSKNFVENKCLCCNSLLCQGKWAPNITLYKLFCEFLYTKEVFDKNKLLDHLTFQKLFNNDRWELPNEVIEIILNLIFNENN